MAQPYSICKRLQNGLIWSAIAAFRYLDRPKGRICLEAFAMPHIESKLIAMISILVQII